MLKRRVSGKLSDQEELTRGDFDNYIQDFEDEFSKKISELVKQEVNKTLNFYKIIVGAFISGIVAVIAAGFLTKGEILEGAVKSIYTPEKIYSDIKWNIPKSVWESMNSGTADNYKDFVSKNEFYEAMQVYHSDIVKMFLLPNQDRAVRAAEILEVGKIPLDIQILMAGSHVEGKPTENCNLEFHNSNSEAILVIPENSKPTDFSWYDCSFGWPKLSLAIKAGNREIDGIRLVGVRRNGKSKHLTVLLSRTAAVELGLPGANSYKSKGFGKIRITGAE